MSPRRPRGLRTAIATVLTVWAFAVLPSPVLGDGGEPGAFLKIGADARFLGMGGTGVAGVGEPSLAYWNPAGLATVDRSALTLAQALLPAGGGFSQIFFAMPMAAFGFPSDQEAGSNGSERWGTLAVTVAHFAAAYDLEARRVDSLNPDYLFSDQELVYGLAYGLPLSGPWSAGLGCKGLDHRLEREHGSGWGLDAGLAWEPWPGWRAALACRQAWAEVAWTTGRRETFPVTLAAGLRGHHAWTPDQQTAMLVEADGNAFLQRVRWHVGMEHALGSWLFLRAGHADGYWTTGAGLAIPWIGWGRAGLRLDYAAVQDRIDGWDHWLTLKVEF